MNNEIMDNHSSCEPHLRLIPPITSDQVRAVIARLDSVLNLDKLQDTTPFSAAGADSLDFFNIISEIQSVTGVEIADKDVEQVNTLVGLVNYLNARMV